jgi:flagellar basal-body rod protein FlgB
MSTLSIMNDHSSELLSKLMEVSQQRQSVISNNLANANTPGYIRKELDFKDQLTQIMKSKNYAEISSLKPHLVEDKTFGSRIDGNNVIIPNEMNQMMQNGVLYNLLAKAFTSRLNILKSAIK